MARAIEEAASIVSQTTASGYGMDVQPRAQGAMPQGRVIALDAVRGIASVVVVLHHLWMCVQTEQPSWFLRPIFAGRASVVLFFVLSGYVLSIPIWRGTQVSYRRYFVRRFFRIYVPYVAAVLFATVVARKLLYSHTGLTPWFNETWQTPITLKFILIQLLTVSNDGKLNTAFWSLRYEVEMSLIFPFLCAWFGKLRLWQGLLVLAIVWKLSLTTMNRFPTNPGTEVLLAISWGACFLLGSILARERKQIALQYQKLSNWAAVALFVISVVCFYNTKEILVPIGACGMIVFAEHSSACRWLTTAIPEYLGRISYSLYLVHATVLWACMILLLHRVPFAVLVSVYLASSLLIGHVACVLIEEPAMRLGRRLTTLSSERTA